MLIKSKFNRGVIALTDLFSYLFYSLVRVINIVIYVIHYTIRTINGVMDDIASFYFIQVIQVKNTKVNSLIENFGIGTVVLLVNVILLIIGYSLGLLLLTLVLLIEICPLPLIMTINLWFTIVIGLFHTLLLKKTDGDDVPTSSSVFFNVILIPMGLFSIILFGFTILDQLTSVIRYENTITSQREIFRDVSKILFKKININNNIITNQTIIQSSLNTQKQDIFHFKKKFYSEFALLVHADQYFYRVKRARKYLPVSYTTTPLINVSKRNTSQMLEFLTNADFRNQSLQNPNNNLVVTFSLENKIKSLIKNTEIARKSQLQYLKMKTYVLDPSLRSVYKHIYIKNERMDPGIMYEFGPLKRSKYKKRFLPSKYQIQMQAGWKRDLLQYFDYQKLIPSYFLNNQNAYLHFKYQYYYDLSKLSNRVTNLYFLNSNTLLFNHVLNYTKLLKNFQFSNNNLINTILILEKKLNNNNNKILIEQKKNMYTLLFEQLFDLKQNKFKNYNTLNYKSYVMYGHITQFSKSKLNEIFKIFETKNTPYLNERLLLLDNNINLPLDSVFGLRQKFGEIITNLPTNNNNIKFKKNKLSLYDHTSKTLFKNLSSSEGNLLELDPLLLFNLRWNKKIFILNSIENKLGLTKIKENLINFSSLKNNYFVFDGPNNNWANLLTDSDKISNIISMGKAKVPIYIENLYMSIVNNINYLYETSEQSKFRLEQKKKLHNMKYSLRLVQFNRNELNFFKKNLNLEFLTLYDKIINFIENIKLNKRKAYNNLSLDEKAQLKKIHNKIKFTNINNKHRIEISDYIQYKYISKSAFLNNLSKFGKYSLNKMQLSNSFLNLTDDCMKIINKSHIKIKEIYINDVTPTDYNLNLVHTITDILNKKEIGSTKKDFFLRNLIKNNSSLICSNEIREKSLNFLTQIIDRPGYKFITKVENTPTLHYLICSAEIREKSLNFLTQMPFLTKDEILKKNAIDFLNQFMNTPSQIFTTTLKNRVYNFLYDTEYFFFPERSRRRAFAKLILNVLPTDFSIEKILIDAELLERQKFWAKVEFKDVLPEKFSIEKILIMAEFLKEKERLNKWIITQSEIQSTILELFENAIKNEKSKKLLYENNFFTQMQLTILTDPTLIKLSNNFNQLRLPKGLFKYLLKQTRKFLDIELVDNNETLNKVLALFNLKPIEAYKNEKKYFDIGQLRGELPFKLVQIVNIHTIYVRDLAEILLEKLFKLKNYREKPKDSLLLAIQKELYSAQGYDMFLSDKIFRIFASQIQNGAIITRKNLSLIDYQSNCEQINEIMLKFSYLYLKQSPNLKLNFFIDTTKITFLTKLLEQQFPGTRPTQLYDKFKKHFFQISKMGPNVLDNYIIELNKQIDRFYEEEKTKRITELNSIPQSIISKLSKYPLHCTVQILEENGFKLENYQLKALWLTLAESYYKRDVVDVEQMIRGNVSPDEAIINEIKFFEPVRTHIPMTFFETWQKVRTLPESKQNVIHISKHAEIELTKKTRLILYEWYELDLKNKTNPIVNDKLSNVFKEYLNKINTMTRTRKLYGTALMQAIFYNYTIHRINAEFPT